MSRPPLLPISTAQRARSFLGRLALGSFALLVVAGCGGGTAAVREVTPWTEAHEAVFQNGLDLVSDPGGLGGEWRDDWDRDIDARVTLADVVALVTVRTVRHDTDLDRRDSYRLFVRVEREYLGAAGDELTLVTTERHDGFQTVESNAERILDEQFIAFVKWRRNEIGEVRPSWHLAPATAPVAERTRDLLSRRGDARQEDVSRRRVVVHRD